MKEKVENLCSVCGCLWATILLVAFVVFGLGLVFGIFCFEGWIFMLLWNWIAVGSFGANALGYWVCVGIVFGLNFVGKMLFGRRTNSKD